MSKQKPDIIILMADQLRYDCLSSTGHPTVKTPALDRLCEMGMRFDNCYTTSPVCMPARSSFAAGTFPHNHGQWFNYGSLGEGDKTYMKSLRENGYRTAHIGKSHLYVHEKGAHLNERIPFMNALGFDDVLEITGPRATVHTDSLLTDYWEEKGLLNIFRDDYRKRYETGPLSATWPSPLPDGETMDDFTGKIAIDYIKNYDKDQPMCTFIGFGGPHEPWDPSAYWAEQYASADVPSALPVPKIGKHLSDAAKKYQESITDLKATKRQIEAISRLYFAKISQVDHWIGKILDTIQERGNMDNTFILFWSDHGERLADRGGLYKAVFYDDSARVPLIVKTPRNEAAGTINKNLCSTVDMTATICEAAGSPIVGFGSSLLPVISNSSTVINEYVFSEIESLSYRKTMIRSDRYKMVLDSHGNTLQLFDMINDKYEMDNLAGHCEYSDIENKLAIEILNYRLRTDK